MTLDKIHGDDPGLLKFYKEKLLIPGWAGEIKPFELDYIKSQLRASPSLKRRWGFKPRAKRLPKKRIRAIARDGLSPKTKNERRVLASLVKEEMLS